MMNGSKSNRVAGTGTLKKLFFFLVSEKALQKNAALRSSV